MELELIVFKGAYFKALKESRLIDDTRKYLSGRFNLDRFTMIQNVLLESLYSMSDLRNPSAIRLYLYLLRNIAGFDRRIRLEFSLGYIKKKLNMGSSVYKAVEVLKAKKMITIEPIREKEYIFINVYPDTWETKDEEVIMKIVNKEISRLKGKIANELEQEEEQILNNLNWIIENSTSEYVESADDYVGFSSSRSSSSLSSEALGEVEKLLRELEGS